MKIFNKRAKFDYQILERFEAGIVLTGGEVKGVRDGRVSLRNSYAKILGDEIYLINTSITPPGAVNFDATKSRKLLLHKSEITSILSKIKGKKLTLVPISLYTKGRLVKAEIALAKPKKSFEKKETLKKKDIERDMQRELRGVKQ